MPIKKCGKYFPVLLLLCGGTHLYAQKAPFAWVPVKVMNGIRDKYHEGVVTKVKQTHKTYRAFVQIHSKKLETTFAADGTWKETVTKTEWKDLPDSVRIAFRKSDYWQWRMDEIDRVEAPGKETAYIFDVVDVNPFDIEEYRPFHREENVKITASGKLAIVE